MGDPTDHSEAPVSWRMPVAPRLAMVGFAIALAVIVVDQLTKWWILGPLGFSPEGCREATLVMVTTARESAAFAEAWVQRNALCGRIDVSGIFDLTMVWNFGVSFGLLAAGSAVGMYALIGFALVLAGAMVVWLWRNGRLFTTIGLGFIIGGALGNVIDRIRFGAVVDFLDFSGLYFPYVFNVADAAINVGVAALIVDWVLEERSRRSSKDRKETSSA